MAADYRSVHTRMWREDEWFVELDAEARLFWIYLFTNPSAGPAGIYRLSLRTAASECGIPHETAQRLMAQISEVNKAHYEDGVIWVVNMRRLQFPGIVDGSREWQTAVRMQRDIDAIPDRNPLKRRYLMAYGYPTVAETKEDQKTIRRVLIEYPTPTDTPSIPHQYPIGETETVTVTETVTETESTATPRAATAPPAPAPPSKRLRKEKPETPEQVTWFRSVTGRFPPKELFPKVIEIVDGRRDADMLIACWSEWIGRGYNRVNYGWFLDWYKKGKIPPGRNGSGPDSEAAKSEAYRRKMAIIMGTTGATTDGN